MTRREFTYMSAKSATAAWLAGAVMDRKRQSKRSRMDTSVGSAISEGAPEVMLRAGPVSIPFVRIMAGDFMMGSPPDEMGHEPNEPLRPVRLTRPFYLAKYQVTRGQFRTAMGQNPSPVKDDELVMSQVQLPVAIKFCQSLSAQTGMTVTLPTEAQWEYACRAGTRTRFYTGNAETDLDRAAWYSGNGGGHIHPPGEKEPNAWGLYDMLGNVWELCSDFLVAPTSAAAVDLVGTQNGLTGALRGGGWMNDAASCRAARRSRSDDMFGGAGIRLLLQP